MAATSNSEKYRIIYFFIVFLAYFHIFFNLYFVQYSFPTIIMVGRQAPFALLVASHEPEIVVIHQNPVFQATVSIYFLSPPRYFGQTFTVIRFK